jgi:hypothetical protein
MSKSIKEILRLVKEIVEISKANNDLLGFICSKISPPGEVIKQELNINEDLLISMEMSELLDKYDAMPEEFGIS